MSASLFSRLYNKLKQSGKNVKIEKENSLMFIVVDGVRLVKLDR